MKLLGVAPGLAVSSIFADGPRESSPAGERLTGAHALQTLPHGGRHRSRRKVRATLWYAVHPAILALVSLFREAAREKGIQPGVCGEAAGAPEEVVSKPVEAGASLSTAPLSTTGIEKLVGEL